MRIIIDLQGAQTSSRIGSIGSYVVSLVKACIQHASNHEIIIALNGLFSETIEPIRCAFNDCLPQNKIRVWTVPGPVAALSSDNTERRQVAELVRESFLASLKPDVVLVSSFFEGFVDDGVTSIGQLSSTIPVAVMLYDTISFVEYVDDVITHPMFKAWHNIKQDYLCRADRLLTLSEAFRQDSIQYLDFSSENVTVISPCASPVFVRQSFTDQEKQQMMQHYGISYDYVMCNDGVADQKERETLITAYTALPSALRQRHQLVIVGAIKQADKESSLNLINSLGLQSHEVVLTGFVAEENLVILYNLCKVFIGSLKHESLSLPLVEAMQCGCAVLAANNTCMQELIACDQALFDTTSLSAITNKLAKVLDDDVYRKTLQQHVLKQSRQFSWNKTAKQVITALESMCVTSVAKKTIQPYCFKRPRLAYLSPLPPDRSGISAYSVDLLSKLTCYYDVDVVSAKDSLPDGINCRLCSVQWFKAHADRYDRVLYHIGNSSFHQHMFALIKEVPGVVVLHDFFLSNIMEHIEQCEPDNPIWSHRLYSDHGYRALQDRCMPESEANTIWKYPCNFSLLQDALGVIVHSEHARALAKSWYGQAVSEQWACIPLLRVPAVACNKKHARKLLGLSDDCFYMCSFGMLGAAKLNQDLLNAWLHSALAHDDTCQLIFVGDSVEGQYEKNLWQMIEDSGLKQRIIISGWVDDATFRHYLEAADIAVQLRVHSRGETSAAVLDCMNYGLATIINAHGSMAYLSDQFVYKLPDVFSQQQLIEALETLWKDDDLRQSLGDKARQMIHADHAPHHCVKHYFQVIEQFYQDATTTIPSLLQAIAADIAPSAKVDRASLIAMVNAIDQSIPPCPTQRQLLVDVSAMVQHDPKTGIQRVVRHIVSEWLKNPPAGWRVEPVYATTERLGYRYARQFSLKLLECPPQFLQDEPIHYRAGDIFIGLDFHMSVAFFQRPFYQTMRQYGVVVNFTVYDLLLVQRPHCFPDGMMKMFIDWLSVLAESDCIVCISQTVANELSDYLKNRLPSDGRPLAIDYFHLGADIVPVVEPITDNDHEQLTLEALRKYPTFLMVSTIEPRKGYAQTLDAFEQLWRADIQLNLVIVGQKGWMLDTLLDRICRHTQRNHHLFWLEAISDKYLDNIYAVSTCLIAASEAEGFGLPLIEAARHKLPIIARDIPIFREVAGDHAFYFQGNAADDLAQAIQDWLQLYQANRHTHSHTMYRRVG